MQRHLPFENAVNFRDMGGYATTDGRAVKWNRLFRCGHMADFSAADQQRLADLGVAVICDFRDDSERARSPAKLPPDLLARVHRLEILGATANPWVQVVDRLISGDMDEDEFLALQCETYRGFITRFSGRYAEMFRLVLQGEGRGLVIHCTAGKDRTGLGAALLFTALGVPEHTILEDYLLSNHCPHLAALVQRVFDQGVADNRIDPSDRAKFDRLKRLFGVTPERLDDAYGAMRAMSGSVDGYIRDTLGVSDTNRAKLREWFVG